MDGDESPCKRTKVDDTLKKKSTLYEMGITQYLTPEFVLHSHHIPHFSYPFITKPNILLLLVPAFSYPL